MSARTETVKACPHGHISVARRTQATSGGLNGRRAETEYYCKTCGNKHSGKYHDPHYERSELIEVARRVNEDREYDLKLGYVWSPSHDE